MKTLLQTLFFFLLVTQICFAQPVQHNPKQTPDWVHYFGNYDYPVNTSYNFVTFDRQGDIYAIGATQEAFPRIDVSIRSRYDSEGNLQSIVEDTNFLIDWITFDSLGNIYAQGRDSIDYCIVKFDPEWNELWKIYTWGNIVVDSAGNLFVSKNQELPGVSNSEVITYKYNSDGIQQWESHFQWSTNSMNYPEKLVSDEHGGIVILGINYTPPSLVNPVVVKYASDGTEEWRAKYNGADLHYWANGLAIDDSGSVYISVPNGDIPSIIAHTVKYNKFGSQQWVVTNSGSPVNLILDGEGNVFLSLRSNGFKTVKYNSNGVQLWSKQLTPPAQTDYNPQDISLDNNDNVYVAGISTSNNQAKSVAVKYDQQGNEQWVFISQDTLGLGNYPGCAISQEGEICVVGSNLQSDGIILKITSGGIQEWLDKYEGVKYPNDYAVDLGVDSLRNIYICGTRSVFRGSSKGLTILKYDNSGNQQWSIIDDSTGFFTLPKMKVFPDGTVIVSYQYYTFDGVSYQNFIGLKCFDSIGNFKWVYEHQAPYDEGLTRDYNILIDPAGYFYLVFGEYINGSPTWDCNIFVNKFSKSGNQIWSEEISENSPGGSGFTTMDKDKQIYLFTYPTNDSAQSNYLWKFDENGQQIWQKSIVYPGNSKSLIVDDSNSVYIGGASNDSYYSDILIKKFDEEGNNLWTFRYDGNAHFSDYTSTMQLDKNRNIFISGTCSDTAGGHSAFIAISVDLNGIQRWIYKENGVVLREGTDNLTIDRYDNAYFSASNGDIVTYKFSNDGNLLWRDQYANLSWPNVAEVPSKIVLNGDDKLLVAGTSGFGERSNVANIITILDYDLTTSSVDDTRQMLPNKFGLSQNFPNPFNPSTKIKYSVPHSANVLIKVFDVLGNEIETLVNEEKPAGTYEITWTAANLPSGVYFYQLRAGSFVETKKMILIK